jgi:hypothetical protein
METEVQEGLVDVAIGVQMDIAEIVDQAFAQEDIGA